MARIILHIGTHKTGTTGMQRSLFDQRQLLKNHGITYDPWPGIMGSLKYAHHGLAHRLARFNIEDRDILKNYRLKIERAIESGEDVIISAEPFYRHVVADESNNRSCARAAFMDRTADYFSGMPVEVSVCFRRPDKMAESLFKEHAGSNRKRLDFMPWLESCAPRFDYVSRLREFEERFDSVKIWCFEKAVSKGIVATFLDEHRLTVSTINDANADRKSVSSRAAMWLLRAKQDNHGMSDSERRTRWYYSASQHAHSRLKKGFEETFWPDAESRDNFISNSLHNFPRKDFWAMPTCNPVQVAWSGKDQAQVNKHYEKWLKKNQTLLEMRKSAKLSPYDADSLIPLIARVKCLPKRMMDWLRLPSQ